MPQEIVPLRILGGLSPAAKVLKFPFRCLSKQVIGDSNRHKALAMKVLDDRVVLWIVLKSAAGVSHACDPEAVQLTHELPGRVELSVV